MTPVVAKLRYLRISPRKVRLVLDLIRGKQVLIAEQQLLNLPRRASGPIIKLLKSAVANAEHNFKLDPKTLIVRQAFADEGPKLKRYRPRAMGRAGLIMKRMSHVTVVLTSPTTPDVPSLKPKEAAPTKQPIKAVKGQQKSPVTVEPSKKSTVAKRPHRRLSHPGEKFREKK